MSEREFMDADYQVIQMVNKGHGPGGQLPSKQVHFIPEERADAVIDLDKRIQKMQKALPVILFGLIILFAFLAGRAV